MRAVCGSGKPPATSKPVMHESLFLRLLRGPREPQWKFGESLSTFWSMVFWSQVTSGTVFGEWVGNRLLMSHPNSLCFISCCWVLSRKQFLCLCVFLILYFCMPFAKWWCFCTRKKLLGNYPVVRVLTYFERQVYLKLCI